MHRICPWLDSRATLASTLLALIVIGPSSVSAQFMVLDDFDSYIDDADINSTWSLTTLETAESLSGNALERTAPTTVHGTGASTSRDYAPALDLQGFSSVFAGIRVDPASVATVRVDFALSDTANRACTVLQIVPATGDWLLFEIDLENCSNPAFDPTQIDEISFIIRNHTDPVNGIGDAGDLILNVDDLLAVGPEIFTDGFENGSTSSWTATVP